MVGFLRFSRKVPKGNNMANQRWKIIKKTCIECNASFDCKSTNRRTQWCPSCTDKRQSHRAKGHVISNRLSRKAKAEGKKCEICGAPGQEYHHVTRLADGGGHGNDNLMFLCADCHYKQHYSGKPSPIWSWLRGGR